jgi:hypothetical protein
MNVQISFQKAVNVFAILYFICHAPKTVSAFGEHQPVRVNAVLD